ncbi:MAG: hypothetical protein E7034_09135 [Akkermansiaceae bacterium]|nr:hypothetical protein [Akkermansiaceae bacterium]
MNKHFFPAIFATAVAMLLSSCQMTSMPEISEPGSVELTRYEKFITNGYYPEVMDIYTDDALMAQADSSCPIVICLSQQRGRLYVGNQVAADWPVSTGIQGRETPTGKFRVTQKKEQYASNRYGKMYNAEGKCIDSDADAFKDPVPEGGKFVGSPMPNWQRLTSDGVGMHTGKVRAGQRLSHGCIRTPHSMAVKLFAITKVGTRVTVCDKPEETFPTGDILHRKLYENKIARARNTSANAVYKANQARLAQD